MAYPEQPRTSYLVKKFPNIKTGTVGIIVHGLIYHNPTSGLLTMMLGNVYDVTDGAS
jgi:hypothetical protein